MHKYLLSLGGFMVTFILVGAGCSTVTPVSPDTDMSAETVVETEVMTDTASDTEMVKADVVINLTGENFSFSQEEIRVKEGAVVTINFESTQGFHDWVVDEFAAATKQVNPGTQTSVTFTADKAGEYEYYCSVGKHREMGMVGKLIVEANDVMMKNDGDTMMKEDNDSMMKDDDDTMMEKDDDSMMKDEPEAMMKTVGSYEAYDASKLALANSGDVVLFFHAKWCPSCKALDSALLEEVNDIPAGLTILKLDYDTQTELKKKYGVTSQHTLVQVDAQGNMIQKKLGANRLSDISGWVK